MSDRSCTACNDLVEYAPVFAVKGVTEEACDSLASNTGLNPDLDPKHDDCDDLHDINDCLVGNMDDEVEAYDVCDWKDFMHEFIPNTYETLKAIICNDCGQWQKIEDMCKMIDHLNTPPVLSYGTRPNDTEANRRCGTIPTKNGSPVLVKRANPYDPDSEQYANFNAVQNAGIYYGKDQIDSCTAGGDCVLYEWIMPNIYHYELGEQVDIGDVLWYVSKTDLQAKSGFSDKLWHAFVVSTRTWSEIPVVNGTKAGKYAHYTLTVNPDGMGDQYFGIVFSGSSYPNEAFGYEARVANQTNGEVLYRFSCD